MAEVALFHHAQGPTPGLVAFAEGLRRGMMALMVTPVSGNLPWSLPLSGVSACLHPSGHSRPGTGGGSLPRPASGNEGVV